MLSFSFAPSDFLAIGDLSSESVIIIHVVEISSTSRVHLAIQADRATSVHRGSIALKRLYKSGKEPSATFRRYADKMRKYKGIELC